MLFFVVSLVVPVVIFFALPRLVKTKCNRPLLGAACLLFVVSWWLPSPLIYGQQTQFMTHFVGGGVFSALLGLYLKLTLRLKAAWYVELAALFALVSALGVANELFEVWLWAIGRMPHGIADTSWDLVANTAGAALFYMGYVVGQWYGAHRRY